MMRIGSPDETGNKHVVEEIHAMKAKGEKWLEVLTGLVSKKKKSWMIYIRGLKTTEFF